MGHARVIRRIGAPIEDVRRLAIDMDRLPEWDPYREVRNLTGPVDAVGTTFDGTMRMLRRSIEGVGKTLEVEPMHRTHLEATSPRMGPFDMRFRYDPDADSTLGTFDVEYQVPAGPFGSTIDKVFIEQNVDATGRAHGRGLHGPGGGEGARHQPPEATNPIVAARCEQSAIDASIWFLPVSMGGEQTATCDVPQGTFLVLVLGGTICTTMTGDGSTVADLVACAERDASRPSYAEAAIDGRSTTDVADYWVLAEPIELAGPDVFSPDGGWAVAATYTMVIAPLSRGTHTVWAYDEFVAQDFAGTTFTVTVH